VLALLVALGPMVIPHAPDAIDLANRRAAPSAAHWFGTDELGRDLLVRVLHGGRVSLTIGLLAALVATSVGVTIGSVGGYVGGVVDAMLMRLTDALLAVPRLLLLMILAAIFQPSVPMLVLLVGLAGWMETARVTRTEVRTLAAQEFVLAARAAGAGMPRIIFRHLIVNAAGAIQAAATLAVARAILLESTLSFFGVGVQPPVASWGSMLYQAQTAMSTEPWLAIFPGAFIVTSVVTVNSLINASRLKPQLKP
jgi:peptide/nickel transport system permease protein